MTPGAARASWPWTFSTPHAGRITESKPLRSPADASGFETRLIGLIGELIREEAESGRLTAAVPIDDLPYVLVRIMVSYIYLGLITGEHPDPDRAARVINALLPGPPLG